MVSDVQTDIRRRVFHYLKGEKSAICAEALQQVGLSCAYLEMKLVFLNIIFVFCELVDRCVIVVGAVIQ